MATVETELVLSQVAAASRAVIVLDEHLRVLLGVTDLLRVMGHEAESRETQRALMRAVRVLRLLQDELVCLHVVENLVKRCRLLSR